MFSKFPVKFWICKRGCFFTWSKKTISRIKLYIICAQAALAFTSFLQQKEVNKKCRRSTQIPKNQNIFLKSENSPDLSFCGFWVKNRKSLQN